MIEVNIFLDENDLYQDKQMLEYIMRYLMHHSIIGASVFPAIMGYGHKHHLHHPQKIGNVDERPVMIMFIDEEEKARRVLLHLKEILSEGMITVKKVERI